MKKKDVAVVKVSTCDKDYFALFFLEKVYTIDINELENRYLELQKTYHPDNFPEGFKKNFAVQKSKLLNIAYKTLMCDIKRAEYLLKYTNISLPETLDMETLDEQFELQNTMISMSEVQLKELYEETRKNLNEAFITKNQTNIAKLLFTLKRLKQNDKG